MATAMTNQEATRLLDASLGKATYTAPTGAMKLALMTANGSVSSAGTEVTGGSYARVDLSAATPAGSTNGVIATNAVITYTNMPAATTVGVEVYDSNGTPRRAWWGALTASKTTGAGDSLSFASGALTISNNL
jgi:hypothetical protein